MDCPTLASGALLPALITQLGTQPETCALRYNGAGISNAALLAAVRAYVAAPLLEGAGPGVRVGVCLERRPEVVALLLALWWRGAAYVPLDPKLPRDRLYAMCELAQIDFIVTQPELRRHVERLPCILRDVEPLSYGAVPAPPAGPLPALAAGELAYILFTSGSSGSPKGVRITQANLTALFAAIVPLLQLGPGSRVLGCANFGFDIAFFELLAPLLCGGTLVLADSATCAAPHKLLQLAEREAVDVIQATPSHWQILTASGWNGTVTTAIATGEPLLRDVAAVIRRHAASLWNLYGPTECCIWSSAHRVTAADLSDAAPAIVSIGMPLPGYGLRLENADDGGAAELVVTGAGVGAGYCNDDASPAFARMCGAPPSYHSGDLCRQDAQGLFHFLGRRDNQVKHNGYRIELDEIALRLRQHMSVRAAACLVRPAGAGAPSLLFACVAFRAGMPQRDKAALNAWLADYLPAWMLPERYFFIDQLPLTANGKLDRSALLAMTVPGAQPERAGSLDAQVTRVFCEVLDVGCIGPYDSFFDAGGSSMLAATLVLALNQRLGCALTLRQALSAPPTVNSIVQLLRGASPPSTAS